MNLRNIFVLSVLLCTSFLIAQKGSDGSVERTIETSFDGPKIYDDRAASRLLYRYQDGKGPLGQLVVSYGRPQWKDEYNESGAFDYLTRGKVWRLGKDFWTVLDTSIVLVIGGHNVVPGDYYLGIHRSQDGSDWSLAVIDAHQARKLKLDSASIDQAPILFKAPAVYEEVNNALDRLAITLSRPGKPLGDIVLAIVWGNHKLSVPIKLKLE